MNGFPWNHRRLEANGIGIHYVRHGVGLPLLMLHGWPEFWYTWRKNIPVLAEEFDVVVPDLRGFGDMTSQAHPTPRRSFGQPREDLRALGFFGLERFGWHTTWAGYVAQGFARRRRVWAAWSSSIVRTPGSESAGRGNSINEIWDQTSPATWPSLGGRTEDVRDIIDFSTIGRTRPVSTRTSNPGSTTS